MIQDRTTSTTEEYEQKERLRKRTKQETDVGTLAPKCTPCREKKDDRSNFGKEKYSLGESHGLLELGDGEGRVETLGTCPGAVQDGVATVQRHGVVESVLASGGSLVTRVGDPAVGLEEDGGSEVLLGVPPV